MHRHKGGVGQTSMLKVGTRLLGIKLVKVFDKVGCIFKIDCGFPSGPV